MTNAFGAIDLFSGSKSISGTDLFSIDKNPLDTLSTDFGSLAGIGATVESALSDILKNTPELLKEAVDFIIQIPIDLLEALTGITGSNAFGILGELLAIPLDFISQILSIFGFGGIGGSSSDSIGSDIINSVLAFFGLAGIGGSGSGLGVTLGADIANLLRLPIDFIDAILNLFGLPDLGFGLGTGTAGSNAAITLIENFLGGLGLGDITGLLSFLNTIESNASSAVADIEALLAGIPGVSDIADLVTWLTTTVYGAAQTAIADLDAFLSGTGFAGDVAGLVALINGLSGDVSTVVNDITTLFGLTGTNAISLAALINALAPSVEASLSVLLGLLGLGDVPSFASFLTSYFPGFLTLLPASHIRNINPELLFNPGFDSSGAITVGAGFTWDGTVGHTAVGSAKGTANGTKLYMLSNPISVADGDAMAMSIWVEWASLVTSGSSPAPIRLEAQPYYQGSPLAAVVLQAETTPATNSSWVQLSGTYTVPTSVDTIYLQPVVDTTATSGTVWFDDGSVKKAGALAGATGLVDFVENLLTNMFGSNILGTELIQGIIPALDALWGKTIHGGLISGITTIEQNIVDAIRNAILGGTSTGNLVSTIETVLGEIPALNILGITGGATLAQDLQSIADGIFQAVHGGTSTGNLISTIKTALGIIPGGNVLGITGTVAADLQSIADGIYQAIHGGTSTGNLISTIKTQLGIIPGANILGITGGATLSQDLQSIADGVYQAVHGGTSTGNLISTIKTALGIIPQANISGLGTALAALLSSTTFNNLLTALYGVTSIGTITTNEQSIADAIYQAIHGGTTTGNLISTIKTVLGIIPGANILGITSGKTVANDLQSIADAITQAVLGGTTTGTLISSIKTVLGEIPAVNILGITGGATLSQDLQSIADGVYQAVHGGTSTGNLISTIKTALGIIPQANISGLGSALAALLSTSSFNTLLTALYGVTSVGTITTNEQAIADAVYQAIHGGTSTGNLISTIKTALGIIPGGNVLGITGTVAQDLQSIADGIYQAIHGGTSTGNLISTIETALGIIPPANVTSGLGLPNLLADLKSLLPASLFNTLTGSLYGPRGLSGHGVLTAVLSVGGKIVTSGGPGPGIGSITTVEQAIADGIYQAIHGGTTTGNLISTIKTVLGIIPSANVLGITGTVAADLQSIADGIYQAIHGGTTTGNLISTIKTQLGIIPGANILGITGGQTMSQDLQSVADGIYQAIHGGTSTGNLISTIKTALGIIPGANVLGITGGATLSQDLQSIADGIFQAVHGGTSTGNLISTIKTALGIIPPANVTSGLGLTNLLADLASLLPSATYQGLLGNLYGPKGLNGRGLLSARVTSPTGKIILPTTSPPSLLSGILSGITSGKTVAQDLQSIADGIYQAIHGGTSTGNLISTIETALGVIPGANVLGITGGATVSQDLQSIADGIFQSIHGGTSTGNLISTIKTQLGIIPGANILGITGGATMSQDLQSIADGIFQAIHGGTSTGNLISTIKTALGIIPLANVAGFLSAELGASFPKTFPFVFGSATSGTLAGLVSISQFQQLLDGLAGNGQQGNTVLAAVGGFQAALDTARSDISQAILDGTSGANTNTGIAQVLANYPSTSVSSVLGQGSLGADMQAIVAQGTTALGGITTTLAGWVTALQAIPPNNMLSQFGMANFGADVQSVVDFAVNALTGGSGTGNAPSALGVNLAAISQADNIVIPPNPGSGTVVHDASGNGNNIGSGSALTNTWSHTTAVGANLAVVQSACYCGDTFSSGGSLTRGVRWGTTGGTGGTAMSNLGGYVDNNFIYHEVWVLWNPPSGTVNVTSSIVEVGFSIEAVTAIISESDTYIGAGGISSVAKATGAGGTNPAITQAAIAGDLVVNSFAACPVTAMGTYTQTQFYTAAAIGSADLGFTAGEAAGASSVTFTDTSPSWGGGGLWTGVSFNITPMLGSEIGSGFMSNRTSTGTVASTNAIAAISSAFYTQTAITADLTWTASTNTVQVTYAGWYMVSIGILLSGKGGNFGVSLFHNGSVAQLGTLSDLTVASIAGPYTGSFVIYLSADDTIQPGYNSTSASNTMTGEATGSSSYFNVALMNRSVY